MLAVVLAVALAVVLLPRIRVERSHRVPDSQLGTRYGHMEVLRLDSPSPNTRGIARMRRRAGRMMQCGSASDMLDTAPSAAEPVQSVFTFYRTCMANDVGARAAPVTPRNAGITPGGRPVNPLEFPVAGVKFVVVRPEKLRAKCCTLAAVGPAPPLPLAPPRAAHRGPGSGVGAAAIKPFMKISLYL